MTILCKIGERTYELQSGEDVTHARAIYAQSFEDQNGFEDELERVGIDFTIDPNSFCPG